MKVKTKKIENWDEMKKQDKKIVIEFSPRNDDDGDPVDDGWRRIDKQKKIQKSLE